MSKLKLHDRVKTTYKNSPNRSGVITTLLSETATIRVRDCDGQYKSEIHMLYRLTLDRGEPPGVME